MSVKKQQAELKTKVQQTFNEIRGSLKKRTAFDYQQDITSNYKLNSLTKLLNTFEKLKGLPKDGKLTKADVNKVFSLQDQAIILSTKLNPKTREQSKGTRRKKERKALGDKFKEVYIYADDIDGINDFDHKSLRIGNEWDSHNLNSLVAILSNRLNNEYERIKNDKTAKYSVKGYIIIKALMYTLDGEDEKIFKDFYYNAPITDIVSKNNIDQYIINCMDGFKEELIISEGSEWRFEKFIKFTIATQKTKSVLGRSYIKLPQVLTNKRATLNIKNTDDKCFEWCLIASKRYNDIKSNDKNEVYHYKKHTDLIKRPDGITFPITTDDIPRYEELNNIQINVFSLDGYDDDTKDIRNCINQEYKSNIHRKEVVNLLLIREGDLSHYVLIVNINRLFASKTNHKSHHFCENCLVKSFLSIELLNKHKIKCQVRDEVEVQKINVNCECPKLGENILKFKNEGNSFKHPFFVVADFESTLTNCDDENEGLTKEESDKMATKKYQKHLQNSFGVKFCCDVEEHSKPLEIINNSDPETVSKLFVEKVEEYARDAYKLLQEENKTEIKWKQGEKDQHYKTTNCSHCKIKYSTKNKRVAHHNHINGEFISSLCNECNLKFVYKPFLPVYLHNLKGYDCHLFVNALYKYGSKDEEITCIPNNEERYISFSKNIKVGEYQCKKDKKTKPITFEIRFLDTIAFMNSSIEKLVDNLASSCNTTDELRKAFPNTSSHFKNDEQFKLMTQKGVYPYEFIDTYEKLNVKELPPQEQFYSRLYNSKCSNEDYQQAVKVWGTFECKTFLDYHNIYLQSDVLLLADVWSAFRETCYKNYNLDCLYYYTAPGLSFDAMLKFTKVELELFTEIEMYEFCEQGIRGGLSQISKRYAKANNKYMSTYNDKEEESYLVYLDANNLYGHAMSQYLPVGDFKWNNEQWTTEKIMGIDDEAKKGYKFKVDLHIPESLHDHFNNYVPLPENMKVQKKNLSQWQQQGYKETKVQKLCTSFNDKIEYVVDYRYLKLCLSLGV